MALIEYRGVGKRFDDKVVLDAIDLSVEAGEIIALIGPSGTGKTVTLKLLIGFLRPDEGEVRFDGIDIARADGKALQRIRQRIGFVFQGSALFDSLTVGENVAYGLRVGQRVSPVEAAREANGCLAMVGLPDAAPLSPQELSGGMRKRVAIARALCTKPEVLLYDEPTAGLDPANVRLIGRLIRTLRDRLGNTAMVVTHDRDLALEVADRVALLLDGKLAWSGPAEVARRAPPPELEEFFAGRNGAAT